MVNFDSEELDQYFPDGTLRQPLQPQSYIPSGETSQQEYTTLHPNMYCGYGYDNNYMQSNESGYYGNHSNTDDSWNTMPSSWMKQY